LKEGYLFSGSMRMRIGILPSHDKFLGFGESL